MDGRNWNGEMEAGCVFLGTDREGGEDCDLYWSPQGGVVPTVIARYGDLGPEYASGIATAEAVLAGTVPVCLDGAPGEWGNAEVALGVALLRARQRGLKVKCG